MLLVGGVSPLVVSFDRQALDMCAEVNLLGIKLADGYISGFVMVLRRILDLISFDEPGRRLPLHFFINWVGGRHD